MPHISVTIPVFNRAHLVSYTIDSVLGQSFTDFDVLVIDDASTDPTVDIVERYTQLDQRVRLLVNSKNLGLTRNWNKCLELSKGPLIQVLLSDDLLDPDYLSVVNEAFTQLPSVGFVAASCRYINSAGEVIHPGIPISPKLYRAGDDAVSYFLNNGFPHVSSIVLRKECFTRLGGFDERIWHGPDVEMDTRLASKYDFYHIGKVQTSFRRHGTNMGNLEYLRRDFLEVDFLKRKLAWQHLSEERYRDMGITKLDAHLAKEEAQVALNGAIATLAYQQPELSRYYLQQAMKYDHGIFQKVKFWKAILLNVYPPLGVKIIRHRLGITDFDQSIARSVDGSLHNLPQTCQ